MGISGMMGRVYYFDDTGCPNITCTTFDPPEGTQTCWYDEVTKFSIVDSVNKREYGHDKSQGWQDVVAGIRRLSITIDAMLTATADESGATPPLRAGRVVGLNLMPRGSACDSGSGLVGWAMIDQISYTYDQERGEPISYTMTLSSKGPWSGFADTGEWGGFECANCD